MLWMRSPTTRAPTGKARCYDASAHAKGSTPSSTKDSGVQALGVAPFSALNDGPCANDQPSSRDYKIGDTVLVRTAGKPAQEATVVGVDAANGSRFNVSIKDRRRKGGWRDHNELSPLFLPRTGALAATSCADIRLALGAPAGGASGESGGTAAGPMHPEQGNIKGQETAAYLSARNPSVAEGDPSPALGQRSTTIACASSLAAQEPSKKIADTLQSGSISIAALAVHALGIGDRVLVSLNAGSPCSVQAKVVRVDNSRVPAMFKLRIKGSGNKQVWRAAADVVPVGLPLQARAQSVTEKEAPRSAQDQPPTTTVSAQEPATKDANTYQSEVAVTMPAAVVHDFAVGDRVLVSLDAGSPCGIEAKVVRVDNSRTPGMFRIRLKGSGKKEIWRAAADVVPVALPPEEGLRRVGVKNDTGVPEIGREQRKQQRQKPQEKQQKQKQQRWQQQQRGQQPTIDASAVVPTGSDSAGQEATVIEAQASDPSSVRDSAKDSRTQGVRQTAKTIPSTTDVSVLTNPEGGGDGPEQTQARKSPSGSGNAENTAQRGPETTLPRIRQGGAAGGGDRVARGGPAVGITRGSELGDYWQNPPPRKRAAATAAASAISSSRIRRVAGRRDGRESDSATKNALANKRRGATKRTSAGKVIRMPRKFGRGLQQRPKVVTPGSAQGRSEPALR